MGHNTVLFKIYYLLLILNIFLLATRLGAKHLVFVFNNLPFRRPPPFTEKIKTDLFGSVSLLAQQQSSDQIPTGASSPPPSFAVPELSNYLKLITSL
jgi:hypothetical protein